MENFRRILAQANDWDRLHAKKSYPEYNRLTTGMARRFAFPPEIGAAVFSALSPNNDYAGNLRDARRLLFCARAGLNIDDFKVSTYGSNKRKAWAIAKGEAHPLDAIKAKKTRSFYLNIVNPLDPEPVTVDGHMYWAWKGFRGGPLNSNLTTVSSKVYDQIANDVRALAGEMDMVSCELQALIWCAWRRINFIKQNYQLEFWCPSSLVAGMGFQPVSLATLT